MQVMLKNGMIVLTTESEAERSALAAFAEGALDHVFQWRAKSEKGFSLHDLGLRENACREPINIVFTSCEERFRPIANLAATPFELHGRSYASVEGFWQGLKFNADHDRVRVAAMHGTQAKRAGLEAPVRDTVHYQGQTIAVGRPEHWALMRQACAAKFQQNALARAALLSTRDRWLCHRVKHDSRTIPGAIMADIWMCIRETLRKADAEPKSHPHDGNETAD